MRPFLFLLLFPAQLFAQSDSIEDEILQKIELGDPAWHPEEEFLQRPSVPLSRLDRKGDCFYLDSLYTGVILEPVYDSLYCLLSCDKGYLTGEKMIRQRFHRDSAFCTVYYSEAAPSLSIFTVRYTAYYPNGKVKSTGMDQKKVYPHFESIFGYDEPDGEFSHYYENGQLHLSYTRRNRNFDGEHLEYHSNGQLKEQRFYELGYPTGTWRQYSETGKKTGKLTFMMGRGHGRWNSQKVNGTEF